MSVKKDLTKELTALEKEMNELERRRMRSIAAIMESLISKEEPSEEEVLFFRKYTAEINAKRSRLVDLMVRIKHLS